MLTTRPRKTVADYVKLPQEHGVELVCGEFVTSPSPAARHQLVLGNLYRLLSEHARLGDLGLVMLSPMDVILNEDVVLQPDLLFICKARRSILRDRVHGAPDLAIEIVSAQTRDRDRFVKKDLYARYGVTEYWIVDPDAATVEVYRLKGGAYEFKALYERTDAIESAELPGLKLPLCEVFEA
jgi:Uma2 family endonuclease